MCNAVVSIFSVRALRYGIASCSISNVSICDPYKTEPRYVYSDELELISIAKYSYEWPWRSVSAHTSDFYPRIDAISLSTELRIYGYSCEGVLNTNDDTYFNYGQEEFSWLQLVSKYQKCINTACKDCPDSCYNDWKTRYRQMPREPRPTKQQNQFTITPDLKRGNSRGSKSLIQCNNVAIGLDSFGDVQYKFRHGHKLLILIMIKEFVKLVVCLKYYRVSFNIVVNCPMTWISDVLVGNDNNKSLSVHCPLYFKDYNKFNCNYHRDDYVWRTINLLADLCLQYIPSLMISVDYWVQVKYRFNVESKSIIISMITGILCASICVVLLINAIMLAFCIKTTQKQN